MEIPSQALSTSELTPDYPGVEEPITRAIRKSEEEVWDEWDASDQDWEDSLRIIHSIVYKGDIDPKEIIF